MKYGTLAIDEYSNSTTATLGDGCAQGDKEFDDVGPGNVGRNRIRKNIC